VEIIADRVGLSGGALVTAQSSTSPNAGKAGDVVIRATDTVRVDASSITTAADHAEGGAITVAAREVVLINRAIILAISFGPGDAGSLTVAARDVFRSQDSAVTMDAVEADGGNITLTVGFSCPPGRERDHRHGQKRTG
jgi:hypothetical protein